MNAEIIGAIDPLASAGVDMGLTAGATAVLGPLGPLAAQAAGPVVKDLLANFFPGPSKTWENVPQNVHDFCTKYVSWSLVDWIRANMPESFGTIDKVKAAAVIHALAVNKNIVHDGAASQAPIWPAPADLVKVYASMGIDYAATKAKIEAAGWHGNVKDSEIVYLPAASNPVVQKVTQLATVANKSLPPSQAKVVQAKANAIAKGFESLPTSSAVSPMLLFGGAALAFILFSRKK